MHDPNGPVANPENAETDETDKTETDKTETETDETSDSDIVRHIEQLVAEEHRLERGHSAGDGLSRDERSRLKELEVQLDQAWDLLRQRRARRKAGLDPSEARQRDSEVVEHYQQ